MLVTARPRSLRRIARMQRMIKEETPLGLSIRTAAGKDIRTEDEKARVLAKLLGFEAIETSERKPKLNPSSAELVDSSTASRLSEKERLGSDESRKESDQPKKRVRRRCPAGQWPCPTPASRKRSLH
ncbi:hypothetical protein ACROYT_G033772 [Oculina patagonica]